VFVPRVRKEFDSMEDAYQFHLDYAKLSGFSFRTRRTSKETKHWVCSCEGFVKPGKENEEPLTDKTSKRIGCPTYIKVKEDKKQKIWYFDHIEEAHNHTLQPSARMVCMLMNRGRRQWMTYLQSCCEVACQIKLQ
jgi:hypothetical protein